LQGDGTLRPDVSTDFELRLLAEAVQGLGRGSHVLDLGCGSGRLFGPIAAAGASYVGLDLDRTSLAWAGSGSLHVAPASVVLGDATRLPFSDAKFSVVAAFRIFHRVAMPDQLLREIARVLEPGGRLLLLVRPRPSLFTLELDLMNGLQAPRRYRSLTFGRTERVRVDSGRLPGYVETLGLTRRRLREAGFRTVRARPCGYEELRPLRGTAGAKLASSLGRFPSLPLAPSVLVLADRPGRTGVEGAAVQETGSVPQKP
jgi:SAM-dependent methyltransferase